MPVINAKKMILGSILTAGILLALGQGSASSDRPDFSGRWILDVSRSRLDPVVAKGLTSGIFNVDHREPLFSMHREFIRNGKSDALDIAIKTDGAEVEGNEDGMPTRASLRWDGEFLVFLTVYKVTRGEARNIVIYRLLDEGKTLQAEESFRGPRLGYDNLWVFSKSE